VALHGADRCGRLLGDVRLADRRVLNRELRPPLGVSLPCFSQHESHMRNRCIKRVCRICTTLTLENVNLQCNQIRMLKVIRSLAREMTEEVGF
jgi:hypothetical protein